MILHWQNKLSMSVIVLRDGHSDAMTLNLMTLCWMTFGITTLSISTRHNDSQLAKKLSTIVIALRDFQSGVMTLNLMTLRWITISITTLSKEDTQLNDSQHNNNHECHLRDFQSGYMIMNLMTNSNYMTIPALSIMTISIATLSIKCHYAEWHICVLLCWA